MRVKYRLDTTNPEEVFMEFVYDFISAKECDMGSEPVRDTARLEISMPPAGGGPKVAMYVTCSRNVYKAILDGGELFFEFKGTRNALAQGRFAGIVKHKSARWATIIAGRYSIDAELVEYETSTPPEWGLWPTDTIDFVDGKWVVKRGDKILFELPEKKDTYKDLRCPYIESCWNVSEYCRSGNYERCPTYIEKARRAHSD